MKIISVRELRSQTARVWRDLAEEHEIVIMLKGKPVGILSATDENTLEQSLQAVRRARAMQGLLNAQMSSVKRGLDKISVHEINEEINVDRKSRAK
jgi:antitoxin (DNA-binding transcriptional repressor) of toxin-antitoxin stability system